MNKIILCLLITLMGCESFPTAAMRQEYISAHPNLDPDIKKSLEKGVARNGMTKEQVVASMGKPSEVNSYSSGTTEQWIYPLYHLYLYFTGDVLTDWQHTSF